MKINLILMWTLLIAPVLLNAQAGERMRDRVEAQRVAFMTRQMELTPEESAAFWPLYNAHRADREKMRKDLNLDERKIRNMSDSEVEELLDILVAMETRKADLRISFIRQLRPVLPARKILMIEPLERAFNREVLKRIRGEKPRK